VEVLSLILPIFALLVTGFIFARQKILPEHTAEVLIQFAYHVAVPALLIGVIAQEPAGKLLNVPYIAALGGGIAVIYVALLLGAHYGWKWNLGRSTMLALTSVASNSGFVALPIIIATMGHKGVLPAAIANIIVVTVFLVTVPLLERAHAEEAGERESLFVALRKIAVNPVILGTLIGIAWAITGLGVPKIVQDYFHLLAGALTPCALFAIGMSIRLDALNERGTTILFASAVKLIILPLLVLMLSLLFGLDPLYTIAAVICAAVPTAKTTFMLAEEYGQPSGPVADMISISTLASIVTLVLWLLLLGHLYPASFAT
jgi:malonate transporter and related proteins